MNNIEKKVQKRLKLVGKKYGFKNTKSDRISVVRHLENDIEEIRCNIIYWRGEYNGIFVYDKIIENIECFVEKYYSQIAPYINSRQSTIYLGENFANVSLKESLNDIFQIPIEDTPEGITAFCDLLEYNIVEKMLPLAEKFNDLVYLERCIREALNEYTDFSLENIEKNLYPFFNRIGGDFRVLIIAKLAGVDDYEQIYERLLRFSEQRSKSDDFFKNYPIVMKNLYEDLKGITP